MARAHCIWIQLWLEICSSVKLKSALQFLPNMPPCVFFFEVKLDKLFRPEKSFMCEISKDNRDVFFSIS